MSKIRLDQTNPAERSYKSARITVRTSNHQFDRPHDKFEDLEDDYELLRVELDNFTAIVESIEALLFINNINGSIPVLTVVQTVSVSVV